MGVDVNQRETRARDLLSAELERKQDLEARWQTEKNLVDRMLALRATLRESGNAADVEVPEPELARKAHDPGWWIVSVWLPVGSTPIALVPDPSAPML